MDYDCPDVPDEIVGPVNTKDVPDSPNVARKITKMKSFDNLFSPTKVCVG